jgi:HD-GYP domain-containing protein (c-di-GMP phosphodiesterase class II)
VTSPLSIPPAPGALESAVPYALTHGQDLVRAPLLLARSLIALSERPHGALAGHSVVLSELLRLLATELGLSREEQEHAELAGLLHDVAKSRSRHLTSYAVWQYVEYEQIARQQYLLPVHLLASVGLPAAVVGGLTHLFERVDGQGFPNNLQGDAIPLLSRLLALGDSYLDFVLSASNPFGRVLTPREALTTLKQKAGTLFDAALVERLTTLVVERGLDLRGRQRQVTL